jgi:hypothetical protein
VPTDDDSNEEENDEEQTNNYKAMPTFCGDLDMVEIARVELQAGFDYSYHLVLNMPPTENEYKKAV